MSFYGKVFKSEKQENLEAFFKAIGAPDQHATALINSEVTEKITKDGDTYTLHVTGLRDLVVPFKNGGQFEEKINDKMTLVSTMVVEGNVITQNQKGSDGRVVIIRREFSDNTLTLKVTTDGWDGVAFRYFKA